MRAGEITTKSLTKDLINLKREIVEMGKDGKKEMENSKAKQKAFKTFNPETDVIVKKGIAEFGNHLKGLTEMAKKIDEIHAVQTGDLFKVTENKKLTSKQKKKLEEEALVQKLCNNALLKIINQ